MTWAEYLIRLKGWKRLEHLRMMEIRELAWHIYIAPHQDRKRLKKSIDAFWPVKRKHNKVTDKQREALLQAQMEYLLKKKEKENV